MSKLAIVTGVGRSEGIGAAVCRELAQEGIHLLFTYWGSYDHEVYGQSEEAWSTRFQTELCSYGVVSKGIEVDLSHPDAYASILTEATEMGEPTILINNATVSIETNYESLTAAMLDRHYEVNMRSTFLLSCEFAKFLKEKELRDGRIINFTSGQDQGPMPNHLAYAATKGAVSAFTSSLSIEVAHFGCTVNAINPGPTDTGWMTEEMKEHLQLKFAMGRVGEPADAARLVGFLVRPESSWITGQVLHSEGGYQRS
ncbi:3-ketoacyl-ACP reductase [Pontibacillus halophilus JSM 076056 = DSM 19796]|uniref:3-ketoacyl-ACP reductase n=1 Tax=Pontibacillus halophilus JSM 076056 = DSM 19796 TaxID=1385510 RepID=A0A0A5GDP4_9BACI|nr:SDR family oxidoreductase [Pontibacillus halophilus]KGX91336.1 3-ketoacyl-ACP reductase [Pontibacillus halophilus JSM 076056 = DSM 19796]